MNLKNIPLGDNLPEQINVLIEIPKESGQVKYEFDKDLNIIKVDRFMQTELSYPCNYGFIPNTLSGDGDPIDVLVYSKQAIYPGSLISVKPIGVLITEDEKGPDEKILAVPVYKVDPSFQEINSYKDLPQDLIDKIQHFFENYKKNEKDKWVKVSGWKDADDAKKVIMQSVENYPLASQPDTLSSDDKLLNIVNKLDILIEKLDKLRTPPKSDFPSRSRSNFRDGGGDRSNRSFGGDRGSRGFSSDRGERRDRREDSGRGSGGERRGPYRSRDDREGGGERRGPYRSRDDREGGENSKPRFDSKFTKTLKVNK